MKRVPWKPISLAVIGLAWIYPVLWTLTSALKTSADIYRGPLDLPMPPIVDNFVEAWNRANLGSALLNSTVVTALTVAGALAIAMPAAFALTRLRPPGRAALLLVILAPIIIPTELLVVPLFSIFRSLGLINNLAGLALVNIAFSVSLATLILVAFVRRVPQDVLDAGRVDGAGRVALLVRIVIPLVRPGIAAVGLVVGLAAWNDFSGAVVLLQRPSVFTAPLALTTFSTFYATDQGLRFAGLAITFVPPLLAFVLFQRSFVEGLTTGAVRD
jgi:raffinose/stachyose/melibiose transport system permease protein